MQIFFSLLYAPLVFFLLRHYDIRSVSIALFTFSLIWLFLLRKSKDFSLLFPLFYLIIALLAFFIQSFTLLKIMPFLISAFFSLFILVSYFQKKSIILYFAKKFSQNPISSKEAEYIYRSTLFWFGISLLNSILHLIIFFDENIDFWLYYSSIGWYFLFIFAGIFQFLHRKYFFLRISNV
ncbi:MAG: hypothetical protein QM493_09680 [Sulfurovum sp.]